MVPAAEVNGDECRAGLDQSPRQQRALPECVPSVPIAELGVLAANVERLACGGAGHEFVGLLLESIHRIECARGVDVAPQLIQVRAECVPMIQPIDRQRFKLLQITGPKVFRVRIAVCFVRIVRRTQIIAAKVAGRKPMLLAYGTET